jgi:beta-lactam-binding protein with PASTA domain
VKDILYNGASITPGTKLQQGSSVDLVLGNGVGENEFTVPNLVGMTYGEAKKLLHANGLDFLVVILDPSVTDTANSYIYWQSPPRMGEDGKRIKIRSGQTMDVRLSVARPAIDTAQIISDHQ